MLFATGIAFRWSVKVWTVFGGVGISTVAAFRGVGTVRGGMVVVGLAIFTSCR